MKSIRRLYFYLVALISVEVVVWGLISLLRSIVDETISGGADALADFDDHLLDLAADWRNEGLV